MAVTSSAPRESTSSRRSSTKRSRRPMTRSRMAPSCKTTTRRSSTRARRPTSPRSAHCGAVVRGATGLPPRLGHQFLNRVRVARKLFAEVLVATLGDENHVLDADADFLAWNVDPRFHGDHHALGQREIGQVGVVNLQADWMAETIDEVVVVAGVGEHLG